MFQWDTQLLTSTRILQRLSKWNNDLSNNTTKIRDELRRESENGINSTQITETKTGLTFQPVVFSKSYVYSAFVDDRIKNNPLIRVMGLAKHQAVYHPTLCVYWYEDGSNETNHVTTENCNNDLGHYP